MLKRERERERELWINGFKKMDRVLKYLAPIRDEGKKVFLFQSCTRFVSEMLIVG